MIALIRSVLAWILYWLGDFSWKSYCRLMDWSHTVQGESAKYGPWNYHRKGDE